MILSFDYPPSNGGIARLCGAITNKMITYYDSVTVFTVDRKGIYDFSNSPKVNLYTFPPKRILCESKTLKALLSIRNKQEYRVICGVWHPEFLLAKLAGFKNIHILGHGTEFLYGSSKFRKYIWLPLYAKWVLKKATTIISNSHYTKSLVTSIQPKAHAVALPLGVDHQFFVPIEKKDTDSILTLVSVSRILQFKGFDIVLEALLSMSKKYQQKIEWHIGGTGSYLTKLKEKVANSTLKDRVTFHGFVAENNLPAFYTQADIFVQLTQETRKSTKVEGFGLVFLEAQSCGVPAIGSNTGGISDAIDHKNGGWLIEQNDIHKLKEILIECIESPKILEDQKKKARKRVIEKCTWDIYCKNLNSILWA